MYPGLTLTHPILTHLHSGFNFIEQPFPEYTMNTTRFIPNTFPLPLPLPSPPISLLRHALEHIIRSHPPHPSDLSGSKLKGLVSGRTGLAYLFLHVSTTHPTLSIAGHPPLYWAEAYMRGARGPAAETLQKGRCGIISEKLSYEALKACISKDMSDVESFIDSLSPLLSPPPPSPPDDPFPSELLYGRAGTLYLIRMIRHFVPTSALLLDPPIETITTRLLGVGDDGRGNWRFGGKHYLGAAHGDIGILTQLVLTTPSLAPTLQPRLEELLSLQFEDGNWPSSEESMGGRLVQWCHGAPGFVVSLLALRPFFPALGDGIDGAVGRGRACVWERGLLKKEPSLCHGIFGNAL